VALLLAILYHVLLLQCWFVICDTETWVLLLSVLHVIRVTNAYSKFLLMFINYVECISQLSVWKTVAEHRSAAARDASCAITRF
jgi:hypothetical protein